MYGRCCLSFGHLFVRTRVPLGLIAVLPQKTCRELERAILLQQFHTNSFPLLKETTHSLKRAYAVLKLTQDVGLKELREKYVDMAKVYHPDSGGAASDPGKFAQLREAYQVVYSHLSSQGKQEEEADYDDSVDNHFAPQHRQYLNYGGFGFGSPSQREKVYKKQRVVQAFGKVSDHKLRPHFENDDDGKSLTLKQKRSVRKSKVTNSIERLVEDMIQESISKGDFDNLPGKGKPLPSKTQYCPFMDINQHNLNQVLVNNGVVPEFVAIEKEMRQLLTDAKAKLYQDRLKLGPEPLNSFNQKKWEDLIGKFDKDIREINKYIINFNLVVPLIRLQKVQLCPAKELQKVLVLYEENKKKIHDSKSLQVNDEPSNQNETFLSLLMSQIAEKVFNRLFRQTIGKD